MQREGLVCQRDIKLPARLGHHGECILLTVCVCVCVCVLFALWDATGVARDGILHKERNYCDVYGDALGGIFGF